MSNYYIYGPNGTQEGPYDKATLVSLIKNHTYTPDCYIWCEGMSDWKPFREVFPPKKKAPATGAPAPNTAHPVQKKKMKGLMIGVIAGALLATGGVTYWLMSDDKEKVTEGIAECKINSIDELYKFFEKELPAFGADGTSILLSGIRRELSLEEGDNLSRVHIGLIALNHRGATEFVIKNYTHDEEDMGFFLIDALEHGAHNVASVLIKHGAKLVFNTKGGYVGPNYLAGRLYDFTEYQVTDIVEEAADLHDDGRFTYFKIGSYHDFKLRIEKYRQNRNYKKCAEYAIDKLGCRVEKDKVKPYINRLKLMGKEKPLTDYISSKM